MHTLPRLTRPLLAGALLLCCCSASANNAIASGTAALRHLQLGVIDLTPNDGQTAQYTLAFTDVVGDGTFTTGADGVLDGIKVQGNLAAGGSPSQYYVQQASIFYHVSLSAHSAVTLSGHMLASDSRFGNPAPYDIYGQVNTKVVMTLADGSEHPYASGGLFSYGSSGDSLPGKERDFLVAFANTGDTVQDVVAQVRGYVSYQYQPAQAVPEPHAYALMLAGLMAVPLARRRQARRQSRNAA